MKRLIITLYLCLSFLLLTGCTINGTTQPSNNEALNKISNSSSKNKKGSMQKALDSWFNEEWTPTVEKDEEIQKKYINKKEEEKYFTLQEYVDKRAAYLKAHPSDYNNSNVHKMETMPVIGNSRKR